MVSDDFLTSVAEETFRVLNYDFFDGKELIISLALVPDEEIKKLNKEYRKNDTVTDILSFPEYRKISEIKMAISESRGNEMFLGELILCYDDISEYAQKEKIALNKELANVIAHGILHLLGFVHGESMFAIQNQVKDKF